MANTLVACMILLLCSTLRTEARTMENDKDQVKPGQLANMNSVLVPPPGTNTEPLEPVHKDSEALHAATTSSVHPRRNVLEDEPGNWCIADLSASDAQLEENIQFACSQTYAPIDCSTIRHGGNCYNPENKVCAASVVMNLFYQSQEGMPGACYFNGSGVTVHNDPSTGDCIYPLN